MTLEIVEQDYHRRLQEMIFFPERNYKHNSQALLSLCSEFLSYYEGKNCIGPAQIMSLVGQSAMAPKLE